MSSTPKILVYDDAIETSEVLTAVYQPRGFQVRRLTSPAAAADRAEYGAAVVVLSSEAGPPGQPTTTLKVLIGRVPEETPEGDASRVAACRLSSLFDYRELVGTIDRLLCGIG